jgi:hypothetical protein
LGVRADVPGLHHLGGHLRTDGGEAEEDMEDVELVVMLNPRWFQHRRRPPAAAHSAPVGGHGSGMRITGSEATGMRQVTNIDVRLRN